MRFKKTYNYKIVNKEQLLQVVKHFEKALIESPKQLVGVDTETTGLGIVTETVFLMTFGYSYNKNLYVYSIEVNEKTKPIINDIIYPFIFKKSWLLWGHNIKFDLHLLATSNIPYPYDNIADSKILARFALPNNEFESLSLKPLGVKYISKEADNDQDLVKSEWFDLRKKHAKKLHIILKKHKFSKAKFDAIVKNSAFVKEDIPEALWVDYQEFKKIPEPNYSNVDRETLTRYARLDIELMLKIVAKFLPKVIKEEQFPQLLVEFKVLKAYYKMERHGIKIDTDYIKNTIPKVIEYLKRLRNYISAVSGSVITEGQHKEIIKVLKEKWNVAPINKKTGNVSAGKPQLAPYLKSNNKDLVNYIKAVLEARTCGKWLSTYLKGILKKVHNGKYHPWINTIGAISGRVSGELQQMPRNGFNNLIHPREFVLVPGGEFDTVAYFDWSQIELRVQAHFILKLGVDYCKLPKCYVGEDLIDLHSANVKTAFPDLDENSTKFKELRNASKTINFAIIYGGGLNLLLNSPNLVNYDGGTITSIYNAFKANYPGVKVYNEQVQHQLSQKGFVKDPYGRKHYANSNPQFNYKVANHLIQGTCAGLLKDKVLEINKYLVDKNLKSYLMFTIHDEIQIALHNTEHYIVPLIKQIMEDVMWCKVPVVCEVEYTKTNWKNKQEWN